MIAFGRGILHGMGPNLLTACTAAAVSGACASTGGGISLVRIDHSVRVKSNARSMAGQDVQIRVREGLRAGMKSREGTLGGVALFVHGAGIPAEEGPRREARRERAESGLQQGGCREAAGAYPMVTGEHDKQVVPDRVRELCADLGSTPAWRWCGREALRRSATAWLGRHRFGRQVLGPSVIHSYDVSRCAGRCERYAWGLGIRTVSGAALDRR